MGHPPAGVGVALSFSAFDLAAHVGLELVEECAYSSFFGSVGPLHRRVFPEVVLSSAFRMELVAYTAPDLLAHKHFSGQISRAVLCNITITEFGHRWVVRQEEGARVVDPFAEVRG